MTTPEKQPNTSTTPRSPEERKKILLGKGFVEGSSLRNIAIFYGRNSKKSQQEE
jgi:hypothetical protein